MTPHGLLGVMFWVGVAGLILLGVLAFGAAIKDRR
jgi:hypothetical protein